MLSTDEARRRDAALAYAGRIGFNVGHSPAATFSDEPPDFGRPVLHRVGLAPDTAADTPTLAVYFDDQDQIRVVARPPFGTQTGAAIPRSQVIAAANRQLALAGVHLAGVVPHISTIGSGPGWFVDFDRRIDGYPVANWPMAWGLDGDKAYVELTADGTLLQLYALQPASRPAPAILPQATLTARLAKAAGVSERILATYHPALTWVLATPPAGNTELILSLGYCERHAWSSGWKAACVDAGTGDVLAQGGAVD